VVAAAARDVPDDNLRSGEAVLAARVARDTAEFARNRAEADRQAAELANTDAIERVRNLEERLEFLERQVSSGRDYLGALQLQVAVLEAENASLLNENSILSLEVCSALPPTRSAPARRPL
jgi:hypothetical protein